MHRKNQRPRSPNNYDMRNSFVWGWSQRIYPDNRAPPGNKAETENTNIDLQHRKKLIYATQ